MQIYTTINETTAAVKALKEKGKSIGFVPTMGALHAGHLSLLKRSVEENDISICSIFVNPIQFNNAGDLEKYPRTLENDSKMLEEAGCDIIFAPSVEEMYPEKAKEVYDFGPLETVMEGAHRPGHFNGVAVVVKRLFDICLPDRAYFGEKDFQQLAILKAMTQQFDLPIEIIGCPIIREADGLAMSSRNVRLTPEERIIAPEIYKTLEHIKLVVDLEPIEQVLASATTYLNSLPGMKVEYLLVADEHRLMPVLHRDNDRMKRVFVALFLGEVRLIDNLKL